MKQINISQNDFSQILVTAEILVDKVEQVFSQNEIVRERVGNICQGDTEGKTETDYNEYLKRRGIAC